MLVSRLLTLVLLLAATGGAVNANLWRLQRIELDSPPSASVLSRDGQVLYIGLDRRFAIDGGIAAYRRSGDTFAKTAELGVAQGVVDVALTPDERTIIATTRTGLVAIDAAALQRGESSAAVVRDGDAPGTNQLVISADNHVFYTNSHTATLGIAELTRAGAPASPQLTIVGHVPLDRVPGGIALAPNGRELFVTSEVDTADPATVPGASDPQLSRPRCAVNLGPSGVLAIISVQAALRDPLRAVIARMAAGCAPVRVALTAGGTIAWVTDRGEARVLAFDIPKLRRGKAALLASIGVGDNPIGVAASSDGKTLVIAHASRSDRSKRNAPGALSVINAVLALQPGVDPVNVSVTLPAGALAREVSAAPNGSFLVTNYDGRSIDIVSTGSPLSSSSPPPP